MGLYMYEVAYTPESVAAQIKEPHDRLEAVKPALEAMGVKIVVGGYPLGEYDVLIGLAVTAGGAVKSSRTTRLLSGQERVEALRKAQDSQYRPAR
jgi:uncharacterized protein with GYD domain